MSDLIKREDAIRAIKQWRDNDGSLFDVGLNQAIREIKRLPSADRPQDWIPCSERMPEEDGDYLVSLAFEWGNEIEMGWLLDGEWVNPNSHVTVAWMPLPKPWKGADDEV